MIKSQALGIISSAARMYESQIRGKNLLIVFGSADRPSYIQVKGDAVNFNHLTGVDINAQNILRDISDKSTNPNVVFYNKALSNKLSTGDFTFKNIYTEQKLQVLVQTLRIATNATMIGDYNNYRINLKTDKITGGQSSFIGLIKDGNYYIPNTVISDDIRKNSPYIEQVLAVLSKKSNDIEYNKIEKVAKKIDIERLLAKINDPNIHIAPELLVKKPPNISVAPNINEIRFSSPLLQGSVAVLASPHSTFRQAMPSFFSGIKQYFDNKRAEKQMIKDMKKALSEKDKQLTEKDNQLLGKDNQLSEKNKQLTEKDSLLSEKDKLLSEANEKITDLLKQNSDLKQVADKRKATIINANEVLNSFPQLKQDFVACKQQLAAQKQNKSNTKGQHNNPTDIQKPHKPNRPKH